MLANYINNLPLVTGLPLVLRNRWHRTICSPLPFAEEQENAYFLSKKTNCDQSKLSEDWEHAYLFTKKQLWPIQIVSEHWSMSFERANIIPQNSCAFEEIDSVSRIHRICRRRKRQFASRERQPQSHKVNIFTEITLWVRFTLLTRSAHGPGEDPFEAVMCTSGGCLSKSHECLQKTSVRNTKYHLNLRRNLSNKEIIKSATLLRDL